MNSNSSITKNIYVRSWPKRIKGYENQRKKEGRLTMIMKRGKKRRNQVKTSTKKEYKTVEGRKRNFKIPSHQSSLMQLCIPSAAPATMLNEMATTMTGKPITNQNHIAIQMIQFVNKIIHNNIINTIVQLTYPMT